MLGVVSDGGGAGKELGGDGMEVFHVEQLAPEARHMHGQHWQSGGSQRPSSTPHCLAGN